MAALLAILWDVDGTVAETERDGHRVAFNRAFAEAGLPWHWDDNRYAQLLGTAGGRERLLVDMASRDDVPADPVARAALAQRLHRLKNAHYARIVAAGGISARPGVLDLMAAAQAAHVSQALVTTTSRENLAALMQRLLGSAWANRFACVVCGEDVDRKKPDPSAHLLALQLLGCPPAHALAIEDAPAGVTAAQRAGVRVLLRPSVYFPPTSALDASDWMVLDDRQFEWSAVRERFTASAH